MFHGPAVLEQGGHALQLPAGGGIAFVQVRRVRPGDEDDLLAVVVEADHLVKEHQVHVLELLPVLGVQPQGGLGVFQVVVGEVAHQPAGEGRQARHPGRPVLRQELPEEGGRVPDFRPHRVLVPQLEDAVLAGDFQGGVIAQEGVSSRARAVGGGLQQKAVPAGPPQDPQGLDGGDEVGEQLPADGDAAVIAGVRQGPGLFK